MNKRFLVFIGTLVASAIVLTFFFSRVQTGRSLAPTASATATPLTPLPTDNTNNNLPTGVPDPAPTPARVIDLAPSVPDDDKAYLWIQHPDGSQDEVRLTVDMIADYIQHLPPGDQLVSDAPPASIRRVQPPVPSAGPVFETMPPGVPSPNPPTAEQTTPLSR